MTILIRGFESNSFSRRYSNLVEFVVFVSVSLSCFLRLLVGGRGYNMRKASKKMLPPPPLRASRGRAKFNS